MTLVAWLLILTLGLGGCCISPFCTGPKEQTEVGGR
jgi:hypothetical protein